MRNFRSRLERLEKAGASEEPLVVCVRTFANPVERTPEEEERLWDACIARHREEHPGHWRGGLVVVRQDF